MKIIQKYNYADLKRKDGPKRLYVTPDGESLPSVTTILSKTKDKSGLDQWRKRVGEKAAEKIISDAAKIGTALHLYIEHYVNEHAYKDLTEVGIKAQKMAQVIIDEGLKDIDEIWGSEVHLYYPASMLGLLTWLDYTREGLPLSTLNRQISQRRENGYKITLCN